MWWSNKTAKPNISSKQGSKQGAKKKSLHQINGKTRNYTKQESLQKRKVHLVYK